MNSIWKILPIATALAVLSTALHAECRAISPTHSVALVELYTSEGCNSCPPADRWLSRVDGGEGKRAVPLALHVDYWDRLGWVDRFASAAFTARQHEEARRQHSPLVYTPQVVLAGRDFSQWRNPGEPAAAIATINAKPARASIELAVDSAGKNRVTVDVRAHVPGARDRAHASVAVALVQSGLVSEVKAGENAGKRLVHDHVVRQWRAGPPIDGAGHARAQLSFTLPVEQGPLSVVAFAEDTASGDVLQALALPLCAQP